MAQLGSGQNSSYPHAIDARQTFVNAAGAAADSNTRLDAELCNDLLDAVVKIQTCLGGTPQGVFGSVAARLQQFLPSGSTAAGLIPFTNTTALTIPGTLSNLGSPAVLFQVYDAQFPAAAMSPETILVTVDQSTYALAITFGQTQSGSVVLSASPPVYVRTFTGVTTLDIFGTAHGLGTKNLLFQVFDNSSPAAALEPQALSVHPTTFDVHLTFGQPQTGTIILGSPGPQYIHTLPGTTTVTIPGATHNLATKALLFQVYNNATPAVWVAPQTLTIHPTTFDVVATFGQAQLGTLVLCAVPVITGNDFQIRDGGVTDRSAVRIFSEAGALHLQPGTAERVVIEERTGAVVRVDVDTLNTRVGIGITPSFQLQLATNSAAKPGSTLWTIGSDKRLKEVIDPYLKGLALVLQLPQPVRFRYNGQGGMPAGPQEYVGFLAQELQPMAPEMVGTYRGKLTLDGPEEDILTYEGHAMVFALINAVKELAQEVTTLKTQVQALQSPPL
jgi:hypothetical protein